MSVDELKAKIRDVPDWPVEGVIFRDIMPLLADREALKETIDLRAEWAEPKKPDADADDGQQAEVDDVIARLRRERAEGKR